MKRRMIGWTLIAVLLGSAIWLAIQSIPGGPQTTHARLSEAVPAATEGFSRAEGLRAFSFPVDYGPHLDFQTEWWYYTGNLDTPDGRHFGYQLTFFRRALLPPTQVISRSSDWATNQVYLAHFAVTDVEGKNFRSFERMERGAAGLAGAEGSPLFKVWLTDWTVQQTGPTTFRLKASQEDLAIDLELDDRKGPILEGDHGLSQKGPNPGAASYYLSQPRLDTRGAVHIKDRDIPVAGSSWMDHEFSTSALSQGQVGWDWFALQLNDGSELMVYNIRRADGSDDLYSSGSWIDPAGNVQTLKHGDFKVTRQATWKSPRSGAIYPAGWELNVPSLDIKIQVTPYLADQEHALSFVYWEGAVKFDGQRGESTITGSGYVELTGYAGSMAGEF